MAVSPLLSEEKRRASAAVPATQFLTRLLPLAGFDELVGWLPVSAAPV